MTKKILWLCSWYPNELDRYTGDFIQRHAIAVSSLHAIDLLYVHKCINSKEKTRRTENKVNANLTEHIIYQPVAEGIFTKLLGLWNYFRLHQQFIQQQGKPDLIHVQIPIKSGVIALYYKIFHGIPYIVTEHYGIYNPYLEHHFKTRTFFYRWFTKQVIKYATKLSTVSKSLGEDINNWVVKKEFVVIPNVVDTSLFSYSERQIKPSFQFVHISNMIPLKNVKGIIEAAEILWQKRQDFKLLFVGSIEDEFYQLAAQKKLLHQVICFEGEIPYYQVAQKIKESDAMIIFSDTESQSCVVLESLCCGRPAIVTRIGGVQELVNESNGLKIDVRNTIDLCEKMEYMIEHYGSFDLKQISAQAIAQYAYEHVGQQFSHLYQQLLKSD